MVQEGNKPTRDNLIAFLAFAGEKGLLKKATAGAYRKACNTILRMLDETEAADLSGIDLDSVFLRHRNIATGKIAPQTLKTYETRTRAAVDSFIGYLGDPSSWKPRIQPRTSKTAASPQSTAGGKRPASAGKTKQIEGQTSPQPSVHIDFQIHISPEATPAQIDQIFASMRLHLYGNKIGNE